MQFKCYARFAMDLYYDGECFIYTDGLSKFIIHPNYKIKVSCEMVKLVNFITATKKRRLDNLQDPLDMMSRHARAQKFEAANSTERYEYGLSDW